MRKLTEVEEARALMTEAMDWSVMKWLREKKRVRKTADRANDALDALNREVKASWSEDLKAAYQQLQSKGAPAGDPQIATFVKRVKEADDEAYRARMDAEDTFDEAEKQLSAAMAREGCRKAIHSWELHEKAIRKAEGAPSRKSGS
jgi:maltose-binding protein MalE